MIQYEGLLSVLSDWKSRIRYLYESKTFSIERSKRNNSYTVSVTIKVTNVDITELLFSNKSKLLMTSHMPIDFVEPDKKTRELEQFLSDFTDNFYEVVEQRSSNGSPATFI